MAGLAFGSALAQSQDDNAYIARTPISGVPQIPYSAWTEAQQKTIFPRVDGFCRFLCVDKYNNTSFPNKAAAERAATEAKVCLGACIVNHLPLDYPNLIVLARQLRADFARAKELGSTITWPLPGS